MFVRDEFPHWHWPEKCIDPLHRNEFIPPPHTPTLMQRFICSLFEPPVKQLEFSQRRLGKINSTRAGARAGERKTQNE